MELILVKPVRKLGRIGDIVKVKNGFGRNYLIPQNLAIRASKINKELIEQQKHEFEANNLKTKLEAENNSLLIVNKDLIFIRQSSDDGKLFGSVSNKEIAKKLSEIAGCEVTHANILLEAPLKLAGIYSVEILLHPEVSTNILVVIARSESEITSVLNNYKTSIASSSENEQKID